VQNLTASWSLDIQRGPLVERLAGQLELQEGSLMNRRLTLQGVVTLAAFGVLLFWLVSTTAGMGGAAPALAAEELKVEGLPSDARGFRAQIEQIISKVDRLIEKLKGNPNTSIMVLDLIQTRDNMLRELPKVENRPDGSKWTEKEARESVNWMLRLLKVQYDKAASSIS
jgi:hypothetical protein